MTSQQKMIEEAGVRRGRNTSKWVLQEEMIRDRQNDRLSVCVCVCVCVRERERARERERERKPTCESEI